MSEAIDIGQITEALNDKADRDLNNTQPVADYVVESQLPTAENNYTWYRLYKSGWVEQGGCNFQQSATWIKSTFTFKIPMADTYYVVSCVESANSKAGDAPTVERKTTTSVDIWMYNENGTSSWEVKGMSA